MGEDGETEIDVAGWSVFGWSASSGRRDYRRPRPRLGCGDVNCGGPDELTADPSVLRFIRGHRNPRQCRGSTRHAFPNAHPMVCILGTRVSHAAGPEPGGNCDGVCGLWWSNDDECPGVRVFSRCHGLRRRSSPSGCWFSPDRGPPNQFTGQVSSVVHMRIVVPPTAAPAKTYRPNVPVGRCCSRRMGSNVPRTVVVTAIATGTKAEVFQVTDDQHRRDRADHPPVTRHLNLVHPRMTMVSQIDRLGRPGRRLLLAAVRFRGGHSGYISAQVAAGHRPALTCAAGAGPCRRDRGPLTLGPAWYRRACVASQPESCHR